MTPFVVNHNTAKSGTTVTFRLAHSDRKSSHLIQIHPPNSHRIGVDLEAHSSSPVGSGSGPALMRATYELRANLELAAATIP